MQNVDHWSEELAILKSILEKAPLDKAIKWHAEVFTFQGKNIVSYGGFKNHFAVWFYNGVFLKDPYQVLVNAQEDKTKGMRQWRFKSKSEIQESRILEYIYEAIEVEKQGLKIEIDRNLNFTTEPTLEAGLHEDQAFREAFEKLTPGKRKEYNQYIIEAKQQTTKETRLAKIKPMVLLGVGLNDKYK